MTPEQALKTDPFHDIDMHAELMTSLASGNMLEIGVRHGCSTGCFLMGIAQRGGHLWSLDINPDCAKLFNEPTWTFILADSVKQASAIKAQLPAELDGLFIDGDHSYEAVVADLHNFGPLVKDGGVIMLHDVVSEYDPGVRKAMDEYTTETGYAFDIHVSWVGFGVIHVQRSVA